MPESGQPINLRLNRDLRERIEAAAAREGLTMSQFIRRACERQLTFLEGYYRQLEEQGARLAAEEAAAYRKPPSDQRES